MNSPRIPGEVLPPNATAGRSQSVRKETTSRIAPVKAPASEQESGEIKAALQSALVTKLA